MKMLGRYRFWIAWGFILGVCFIQSCITQERCARKFPPAADQSDSTRIHDSISIVRDTIFIPSEPAMFEDTIPCPPTIEYHKEVRTGTGKLTVDIKDGKIQARCNQDSLQLIIDRQKQLITTYRNQRQIMTKEIPLVKWYDIWARWIAGIALAIAAFMIGRWSLLIYLGRIKNDESKRQ